MKVSTKELLDALSVVKPGLANKEILDQTTSFAFLNGKVVTYNDEISISHPLTIDFEGAVKAEELYGLLGRINKDEVMITGGETELSVSAGKVKAGIRLETEIRLPLKDITTKMVKLPNPKQFCEFVGMAMRTCSNDTSQPKLTCVAIQESGLIMGSDGYRIVYCQGEALPFKSFLLPARNAAEAVKINPTSVSVEKAWVHFKNSKGTIVSCRKMDESYMPEDAIQSILKFNVIGKVEFPQRIDQMLDRVYQFAKRASFIDELVEVEITAGKLTLKANTEDTGSWIKESALVTTDKSVQFIITPSLFKDVMGITRIGVFDKGMQKMKFKGAGWQYVLLLRDMGVKKASPGGKSRED